MRIKEDLLIRLKAGEEKAFETLYWTYNSQVYHFINSLLFDKLTIYPSTIIPIKIERKFVCLLLP